MITFLVNFDKDIDNIELTKLYFYPYLKEQKIKIINSSNKSNEDIFNEIKYYIYNSSHLKKSKKEFQFLFIVPIYDTKSTHFDKNLTNRILNIKEDLLARMADEKLDAEYVNYITVDDLERDFLSIPLDVNAAIAEELDKKGYISAPIIQIKDLRKIEHEWKKLIAELGDVEFSNNNYERLSEEEKEKVDSLKEIFYIVDEFIKEKKDKIEEREPSSIEDAAIRSHIKKYDSFRKKLVSDLEYDFKMKVDSLKKRDLMGMMISILIRDGYYYEYLFNREDILKLENLWKENQPSKEGEEEYNLSNTYIEKLKELREKTLIILDEIIKEKLEGLETLNLKNLNSNTNIYIDKRTIRSIGERLKDRFIKKKIDMIIAEKSLKYGKEKFLNPSELFKVLLKENYSLARVTGHNDCKIFRIPFEKRNKLEFNQNLLKLSYFILFMVEYVEQNENYIYPTYLHLEKIEYKKNYSRLIFERYINLLEREKNRIEAEKKNLKTNIEIEYYETTKEIFRDLESLNSLVNENPPTFERTFCPNEIKEYFEWIKEIDEKFSGYIEYVNRELLEYQSIKNRFLTKPRKRSEVPEIDKAVENKKIELNKLREELNEIETKIEIDIKNNWLNDINKKLDVNELKDLLEKRPTERDIGKVFGILIVTAIFSYGYYTKENFLNLGKVIGISGIITGVIVTGLLSVLSNKIKNFLTCAETIKTEYINILNKKFEAKKARIDKEIEIRVAEKNYQLVKRKEEFINEQQELLEYYKDQVNAHCQSAQELKRIINNISENSVDEVEYLNETFNVKLPELDHKKAPFENARFNPCKYIEIAQYKDLIVCINQQENRMSPKNLFGCYFILLNEDKIYSEAVE